MERNLDRRVELLVPVRDPDAFAHLRDIVLGAYLRDTENAMVLDSTGTYERPAQVDDPFDAHQFLLKHYMTEKAE